MEQQLPFQLYFGGRYNLEKANGDDGGSWSGLGATYKLTDDEPSVDFVFYQPEGEIDAAFSAGMLVARNYLASLKFVFDEPMELYNVPQSDVHQIVQDHKTNLRFHTSLLTFEPDGIEAVCANASRMSPSHFDSLLKGINEQYRQFRQNPNAF